MIREALELIMGKAVEAEGVSFHDHAGQTFATRKLHRMPEEPPVPTPDPVPVSTLRALAAYLEADPDGAVVGDGGLFLSVVSPTEVHAITATMGEDEKRQTWATAKALLPTLRIGQYMSTEELGIHLRTCFVQTETRDEVVAFLGGVVDSAEVKTEDDGISQGTTLRKGISMVREGTVPSPVKLRPYRTFHDVEQPEGEFILRLQKGHGGVQAALFEADGGAWRHTATELVAAYLREKSPEGVDVFA